MPGAPALVHDLLDGMSIPGLLCQVSEGDDCATAALWEFCRRRLMRHFSANSGGLPAGCEDDLCQETMAAVYDAINGGRFPHCRTLVELWRAVLKFGHDSRISEVRKRRRRKRDARRTISADAEPVAVRHGEINHEIAIIDIEEELREIARRSQDRRVCDIVSLLLKGQTASDIAVRTGYHLRFVQRALRQLGESWQIRETLRHDAPALTPKLSACRGGPVDGNPNLDQTSPQRN